MKKFPLATLAACVLWQDPAAGIDLDVPAPAGQTVEWLSPTIPLSDRAALRAEARSRIPATRAAFPADVELDDPRQVGGQTWLNGRYTLLGAEIAASGFAMVFNEEGKLFAFVRPAFSEDALGRYPGPATVSAGEAERIAREAAGAGRDVRICPLCYAAEMARWVYSACYLCDREPTALSIDGRSGEIFRKAAFGPHLAVSGTLAGSILPFEGPAVRRAYGAENGNLPVEMPLPLLPLALFLPGEDKHNVALTREGGSFDFACREDGLWGIRTRFDTIDFKLEAAEDAQSTSADASGVGGRVLDLTLVPRPGGDLAGENIVGFTTTWIYLERALAFAETLQARNFRWPAGFGGWQDYVRGMPAFYHLTVIRLPVEDGKMPGLPGGYMDAFPPARTIWISEANDLFHDWTNPALWHEFGHALVSAFTGQINDPPPNAHDGIVEEFAADFFALLLMEYSDPSGEIPHVIGRGLERGYPDSFQRDVRDGLICTPDPGTIVPCRPRRGFGIYPYETEYHKGSLVLSGFFYDLWVKLVARYGREEGFWRIADIFVRYIDDHRGNKMPRFGLPTIYDILIVDDNPDLGGDNIPQNGSPDWDLIVEAAAQRNLWLHPFVRGDVNQDGAQDLSDAVCLLGYLFLGADAPSCLDAGDANDDGGLDIADALTLLRFLFGAGGGPAPPRGCEGLDPTPDDRLTCVSFSACPR